MFVLLQWFVCVVVNVYLSSHVAAEDPEYLQPEVFVRRRYHASAKIGDWIYIDGGEFSWKDSNGTIQSGPTSKTHALSLLGSWTNSSVRLQEIDRGNAPLLNHRTFWVDEPRSTIYTYGGEISWLSDDHPEPPKAWKFIADGKGGGDWAQDSIAPGSQFSSLSQPASGSHTYGNAVGYYLGGHLVAKTYPSRDWYPVNGLITYNMTSKMWTNSTPTGYGLVPHHGIAHFVPNLGPAGVVLWMGGRDSTDYETTDNDARRDFSNITVYEPESGKWFYQTSTGTVPSWRQRACAVGVQGENNTYEIFMYAGASAALYGGSYPTEKEIAAQIDLDEVYVLSLPAFVWFKANYTATKSRQGHTCHVIGNRQLLTIGGIDPGQQEFHAVGSENATDAFTQGLAVFDLSEMAWSDRYDAEAPAYVSPRVVSAHYSSNPRFPTQWDVPELESLVINDTLPIAPTPNPSTFSVSSAPSPTGPSGNATNATANSSAASPTDPRHNSRQRTGVVAGAASGSCAFLIIVGIFIYLWARRRSLFCFQQRRKPSDKRLIRVLELDPQGIEELHSRPRFEMPDNKHEVWEMPAGPAIPKVRLSAVANVPR